MKKNKSFHDQLNWVARKLTAKKKKNPHFFYYSDDTELARGNEDRTKTMDAVKEILLSMPKSRLRKLVSCSSCSYISSYSYWRGNAFINSGYNSKLKYSVIKNYLDEVPKMNSIAKKKNFIQVLASCFGDLAKQKPKLFKWGMKNADGLFLYNMIDCQFRYKGLDNDLCKILLKTKDQRVQKKAIDNMEVGKLKSFNAKYISTEVVSFSDAVMYKLDQRLKNQNHPDSFVGFLKKYDSEHKADNIPWTYQSKIRKNLSYIVPNLSQTEIINYSQTLISMLNTELNYGSYYYTANNCLHILTAYLEREKVLFLLNGIKDSGISRRFKEVISKERTQWDN